MSSICPQSSNVVRGSTLSKKPCCSRLKMTDEDDNRVSRATTVNQTVIEVTREFVRRHLELASSGGQFDRAYEYARSVYEQHRLQLDHLISAMTLTDRQSTTESFGNIVENVFSSGYNWGRVTIVIVFAGCVTKRCLEQRIITTEDADGFAEELGMKLAEQLLRSDLNLVRMNPIG